MLTSSRRIDTNGLPPDRGFLTNFPLPDQQDYKCWTKFNAQGWGGGGIGALGIYRGMVIIAFFEQFISDLTVVKLLKLEDKLKFVFIY